MNKAVEQSVAHVANSAANTIDVANNAASQTVAGIANSNTVQSLDNALATMITESVKATGNAIAWTKDQIPDVISQLLMWQAVSSGILCLVGIILTVGVWTCVIKYWKSWAAENGGPVLVVLGIFASIFTLPIIACNMDWLKIWIAPKVYLIEYAMNLVKAVK